MSEEFQNNDSVSQVIETIKNYITSIRQNGIALAFSGGVDSTFLLHELTEGRNHADFPLVALIMHSAFLPDPEIKHAIDVAERYRVPYRVLTFDPLELPQVRGNSRDRCYWCKRSLFTHFRAVAEESRYHTVLDGTNADDLNVYRPGLRALRELGIRSPLAELGITKHTIRACASALGLECARQPSKPCLATRFEYDTVLTDEMLARVAEGESYLRTLLGSGADLRLRVREDLARIEVASCDMPVILAHRDEIAAKLKSLGYRFVCLDLAGFRSGSYDSGYSL